MPSPGDKQHGPKPKPALPHDAMPGILAAAARVASVPLPQGKQSKPVDCPEAKRARAAVIVALIDANFLFDEIAMAMHCVNSTISRTRQKWWRDGATKAQAAVYAEATRLIERAMKAKPEAPKPDGIFAKPGEWVRPYTRRCPTGAELMAEHREQEQRRADIRRKADGYD